MIGKWKIMLLPAAAALMSCGGAAQGNAGGSIDPEALYVGIEREHDGQEVRLGVYCYGIGGADDDEAMRRNEPEFDSWLASSDPAFRAIDGQPEELVFVDLASYLADKLQLPAPAYFSEVGKELGMAIAVRTSFGEGDGEIKSDFYRIGEGGIYYVGVAEQPGLDPFGVSHADVWR